MYNNPNRNNFQEKDFLEIVDRLKKLLFEKGLVYNRDSVVYDYFYFGEASLDTMLWIKTLREMNKPYDSLSDENLIDLIIYAMFKIKWNNLQKDQPNKLGDEL